jgi:hypothetical protein
MPTTRKPADDPPDISPEQRTAFDAYVTELSQLGKPPDPPPGPTGPKPVTDAQWDAMSDRARESWVRQLVDARLDDLSRDDEIARHAAEIEALKKKPEVEGAPAGPMPTVLQRLQKFLWGEPNP